MSLLVPDGARSPIRCIVKGCAEQTGRGKLICSLHAEALRPVPPAVFSHEDVPRRPAPGSTTKGTDQ